MLATLALLLTGCNDTADIRTEPIACGFGYELRSDGLCYEVEADTGGPDTDTDTGEDTDSGADTDTAADTDSGETGETGDTDSGPVDLDGDGAASDVDCDDGDPSAHPGAVEVCDGVDQDCDGTADDGVTSTFYDDDDGDGYGDAGATVEACAAPGGYVANADDCDDARADTFPGAADDQGDGLDNDCDGAVDEDFDACAASYGWAGWWTTATQYVGGSPGTYVLPIEGTATVCALTCDVAWLTPVGISEAPSCSPTEAMPYALAGEVNGCVTVSDPGAWARGTCEVYTSAGTYAIEIIWNE